MTKYSVYILCNLTKTTLYVGVTNNLRRRLWEHTNEPKGFVKRYRVNKLIYQEHHDRIKDAIAREKQIKRWSRSKKDNLIAMFNPDWHFLNRDIL